MIGMAVVFFLVTVAIAAVYGAWVASDKEARSFVLRGVLLAAVFTFIALAILFVIVNVF